MTFLTWPILRIVILVVFLAMLYPVHRYIRPFFWRIVFCLAPVVLALIVTGNALSNYWREGSGFKLGVDLVGGTILVYEVDADKMTDEMKRNFKAEELASRLKNRLDPNDLYNVTVRPIPGQNVENTRVEIILPTGGAHQDRIEQREWQKLVAKTKEKWPALKDAPFNIVPRGNRVEMVNFIHEHSKSPRDEVQQFVDTTYKVGTEKKDVTAEQIQQIKDKISQVGSLEFRIFANDNDDKEAIKAAQAFLDDPKNKAELQALAVKGLPPPSPKPPSGNAFTVTDAKGNPYSVNYSWVEVGKKYRWDLNLNNAAEDPWKNLLAHLRNHWGALDNVNLDAIPPGNENELVEEVASKTGATQREVRDFVDTHKNLSERWKSLEKDRDKGAVVVLPHQEGQSNLLVFSRKIPPENSRLTAKQREEKKYEYFVLTRDPETPEQKITGNSLTARADHDEKQNWIIRFTFDTAGGNLFYDLTSRNVPTSTQGSKFFRHLAIILDGEIISAPSLNDAIRSEGQISGNFSEQEVNTLVSLLRSGALPATLKPQAVSENTMGATLGADTVYKGTVSIGIAFLAVLAFMCVYYRFAGFVASVALLANLLLTVAFMALVNATFTLPGLAGLVLMIGMAVDANVLIYERLREERDRGASLALAIRNGYDRAFPTIIDTHLSSIFTAIVLYIVGNDQLKGFGISLAVGLIISLFTSLYMTRLIFDFWLSRNWLKKLSMLRMFSRPNFDFMRIRYFWFTATLLLTILGISVFIFRLPEGLNIDFNGGTAYGGQLVEPLAIGELRELLGEDRQKEVLRVADVVEVPAAGEEGYAYAITYQGAGEAAKRTIHLPNKPEGSTLEEQTQKLKERAGHLPDISVEQIFPSSEESTGNRSRHFTIRTSEKAPELVQASIGRLLGDKLKKTSMSYEIDKDGKIATLTFTDPVTGKETFASPTQVSVLIKRESRKQEIPEVFTVNIEGEQNPDSPGQFSKMKVSWDQGSLSRAKLESVLQEVKKEFEQRPLPDRLENFDQQLAKETQLRAMYAILASWVAILFYLWFRFGSWTFGLAAVLCLVHDLFFTLGIIAFCHYIAPTWFFGTLLQVQDFKIHLPAVAALLTLVGYSVNDTIVVFDRIREVRGKNPELTPQMINDSVNETLSRTLLAAFSTWLVVTVLYFFGGEGVHLFAFVMVVGVVVGTYSSIYVASPLLLIFGEGAKKLYSRPERKPEPARV